jgi:hypothetical protein
VLNRRPLNPIQVRGGPTLVTWELAEEAGGCRVTICHSGWTPEHEAYDGTAGGWRRILELLRQELETGRIPLKTRIMFAVMGWMSFLLPRSTKTEHADEAWRARGGM